MPLLTFMGIKSSYSNLDVDTKWEPAFVGGKETCLRIGQGKHYQPKTT